MKRALNCEIDGSLETDWLVDTGIQHCLYHHISNAANKQNKQWNKRTDNPCSSTYSRRRLDPFRGGVLKPVDTEHHRQDVILIGRNLLGLLSIKAIDTAIKINMVGKQIVVASHCR
ncbi:hypothetical protein [Vibrio taketomensis]|uniref:hypothetical protein n=1 Tax=Vibrio taketomensis TaxID=2572923 RepID=UPI0018D6FBD2|nr:hypothetical protein [Vibrio taketomensis]